MANCTIRTLCRQQERFANVKCRKNVRYRLKPLQALTFGILFIFFPDGTLKIQTT